MHVSVVTELIPSHTKLQADSILTLADIWWQYRKRHSINSWYERVRDIEERHSKSLMHTGMLRFLYLLIIMDGVHKFM